MNQINKVRVFVASPGDVRDEREQLQQVIDEINTSIAAHHNLIIELVRWETHVTPGMGRPQALVNNQIGPYDIFIGIMWKRFGTPSGVAESGTEEEFRIAYDAWKLNSEVDILFYFCEEPFMPSHSEMDQVTKVLSFRKELTSLGLIGTYSNHESFANVVRPHLTRRILDFQNPITQPLVEQGAKILQHEAWLGQVNLRNLSIKEYLNAPALTEIEIPLLLKKLPRGGWSIISTPYSNSAKRALRKEWDEYIYDRLLEKVKSIGLLSHKIEHHPDILISGYTRFAIESWSHTREDITIKDFILAANIEDLVLTMK
jgi:pterin-4a-carbinolamine dehydratase